MKKKKEMKIVLFVFLIALISLIEGILIFFEKLPPITSYSCWNILFSIAKLSILVYVCMTSYKNQIKKSVFLGAILGMVSIGIMLVISLISKFSVSKPIFGIYTSSSSYFLVMFFLLFENVLLYMIIAALSSWISGKFRKK